MGIWTEAITALIPERKATAVAASIPTWQASVPQFASSSYDRNASQGYLLDEVVYACVETRATSAAEPKIVGYRGEEKITEHESLDLLNQPNPFMDGYLLAATTMMYMDIGGNAFWEKVRSGAGKLAEIWTLRPDRMRVIPDARTFVGGYRYTIGDDSFTLPAEDVIHFKTRHPLDDYYGLSPLAVLAGRVDLDVWSREFTASWFRNAGVPAGMLNIMRSVNDQERTLIRERFRQQFGGPSGWHSLLVIDGGEAKYEKMGAAANEGNITDSLDMANEARICMVYSVPASLIGARVGMNGTEARITSDSSMFWRNTLAPIYRAMGSALTRGFKDEFPDIDRWEFDLSTVQAMQENEDLKVKRYTSILEAGGMTWEEYRVKVGLPEQPEKVGTLFVPIKSVPTPSDMLAEQAPQAGLTPRQQAQAEAQQASGAEQGLTPAQLAELLPGDGKQPAALAAPNGRTNGNAH